MKPTILFMAAAFVAVGSGKLCAQGDGRVYHVVGPALFTNAAAWGYADGEVVAGNFVCGVYAGVDTKALAPCFGPPGSYLKRPFSAGGYAYLWGTLLAGAPPGRQVLIQFRAWPEEFGTYEEAVASAAASPPVGVSQVLPAIPSNLIIELPIQTGPMWVSPVAPTSEPLPPLICTLAPGSVVLCWPTNSAGLVLVSASSLSSNAVWTPVGGSAVVSNGQHRASVPMTSACQFFRLRR